jgi:hypothetical protein
MLHIMAVPNSMWSCVVSIVVYLRNRTYNRSVGLTGGILLTLLTSSVPDASKFHVFGCAAFAKVPDKLRRKLSEKAFRGVMVGYPTDAPGYRVCNPETHHHFRPCSLLGKRPGLRASPLTRSSRTLRIAIPLRAPHRHPTLSTPYPTMSPLHRPIHNRLLQPPVTFDSGRTSSATWTL